MTQALHGRTVEWACIVPPSMADDMPYCTAYWKHRVEEDGYVPVDEEPTVMIYEEAKYDGEYIHDGCIVKKIAVLKGKVRADGTR